MPPIPAAIQTRFEAALHDKAIPKQTHGLYKKWLRYYLDFCHKYHVPHAHGDSLGPFLNKLHEKRQIKTQQRQASHAIALYYDLIRSTDALNEVPSLIKDPPPMKTPRVPSHRSVSASNGATSSNKGQP